MRSSWFPLSLIAFFTVVVLLFFGLWLRSPLAVQEKKNIPATTITNIEITSPTVTFLHPKKGATNPEITIVEFGDFLCSACQSIQETLTAVLKTDPSVQLVWKYLPNEEEDSMATKAAIAAACAADQKKFWEYHDLLFERQIYLGEEQIGQIAEEIDLNKEVFENCYTSQEPLAFIRKDYEEGLSLQITALPTLFIGQERFTGALSLGEIRSAIEQARARIREEQTAQNPQ